MRIKINKEKVFTFLILWEFFFFDNLRLRLYPYIFWPIMFGIAIIGLIKSKKFLLSKYEALLLLPLMYCIFSSLIMDSFSIAVIFLLQIILYYFCIRYIISFGNSEFFFDGIFRFSLFHLVMLYIQKYIPSLFAVLSSALRGTSFSGLTIGSGTVAIYTGFTGQSSTISLFLMLGLIVVLCKLNQKHIWYYYVIVIAYVIGIFLTNRRTNSICAVAVILIYLLLENRALIKKILVSITGVILVVTIGINNIPGIAGLLEKIALAKQYNNLLSGREGAWETAIGLFKAHPWFGIGYCKFTAYYPSLIHAHNSYLQKLCELGLVGTILFFLPFVLAILISIRNIFLLKKEGSDKHEYSKALLSFLFFAYTAALSFTEGMFETDIFFLILFFFQLFVYQQKIRTKEIN